MRLFSPANYHMYTNYRGSTLLLHTFYLQLLLSHGSGIRCLDIVSRDCTSEQVSGCWITVVLPSLLDVVPGFNFHLFVVSRSNSS